MALTEGTNSYISMETAEEYFARRLDVSAWDDANESDREAALMTATLILDTYAWVGTIREYYQSLAWPRKGAVFSVKAGVTVAFTEAVPEDIGYAQAELAYHLLNNDGLYDDTGKVIDLTVGPIKLGTVLATNKNPPLVKLLIKPYLAGGGTGGSGPRSWWRNN